MPSNLIHLSRMMFVLPWLIFGCSQEDSDSYQGETVEVFTSQPPAVDVSESLQSPDKSVLELKLKPGDRFPLRKVIEQKLIQDSLAGTTQQIETRLELLFRISVLDKVEDRTKLSVVYDRVQYAHRVGSQTVHFDSDRPPATMPVALQPYQDMVGDGFNFWLGPKNRIVSAEGFTDFLNRCLRNIPESEQKQVVLGIEAGSGESGIANFIDNSLGILPYNGEFTLGDSWQRPTHISRPVPLHVNNTYTLTHVEPETATIDLHGTITPSTTLTSVEERKGVRVTVTGGKSSGSCTIFKASGLPKQSQVEERIDMTVLMSGALQFNQQKLVTTTIEAFPQNNTQPVNIELGNAPLQNSESTAPAGTIRRVSGP